MAGMAVYWLHFAAKRCNMNASDILLHSHELKPGCMKVVRYCMSRGVIFFFLELATQRR